MGQFLAAIEEWVESVEGGMLAIFQQSTQEMVRLIKEPKGTGGRMPIDTSFLQNSLQGSYEGVPAIDPKQDGTTPPQTANATQIEALIAGLELGMTIHFGFTAVYAMRQNYGFTGTDTLGRNYNQPGNFFVELALQQWPQVVENNQRRLAGQIAFGGDIE